MLWFLIVFSIVFPIIYLAECRRRGIAPWPLRWFE